MKKAFKIISVFLVLILTLSTVPITAKATKRPTLTVDVVEANPGDEVEVKVRISGNYGIAGALIKISYDSKLTLIGAENGDAFGDLSYTKPGELGNPAKFLWDAENEVSKKDGTILKLIFKVSKSVDEGSKLCVNVVCESGDAYDVNMDTIEVDSVNGGVVIIKEKNDSSTLNSIISSIKNLIFVVIKFIKYIFGGKY